MADDRPLADIEIDIACVIARIEQINDECWIESNEIGDRHLSSMGEHLWDRILTCDVPRLRRHLSPKTIALMEDGKRPK